MYMMEGEEKITLKGEKMTQLSAYAKRRARARAKDVWMPEGWAVEPHLLSTLQVMHLTDFSAQYLSRLIEAGKFPKPKKLSARRNAWNSVEIAKWISGSPLVENKTNEEMEEHS